jgi:hypothetical protein
MLRRGAVRYAQSVAFFSEAMFRPNKVWNLTPDNAVEALCCIPHGCRMIRRWPQRALITDSSNAVVGIYDPMLCLPQPMHGGIGGLPCEEYIKMIEDTGPSTGVMVLHREGICCVILDSRCTPVVGPVEFLTRSRSKLARNNIQATRSAPVYEEFFLFLQQNSSEFASCRTLYRSVTSQADALLVHLQSAERFAERENILSMSDSRWVSPNRDTLRGIYSRQKMSEGEDAKTLDPSLLVAACGSGKLQLKL